jgi:hypothetical protein
MTLFEAYDAILALGAAPAMGATRAGAGAAGERAAHVATMRATFEGRTGAFVPEDPWFEARSRAFWDDAVTTQGFARTIEDELPERARVWVPRLERAHRGLFVPAGRGSRDAVVLRDVWGGAEMVVHDIDDAMRDALAAASAPLDARLVGSDDPARVGILPGAVFHPADAAAPIEAVLAKARSDGRTTGDVLDALLRMERGLRASARVKAGYAYRPERL